MARFIVCVSAAILHLNDFTSCSVFTRSLVVKGLTFSHVVQVNEVNKCQPYDLLFGSVGCKKLKTCMLYARTG